MLRTLILPAIAAASAAVAQTGWQLRPTPVSPPTVAPLAYDEAAGETVLFGGFPPSGSMLDETWIWNGASWQQRTPAISPPPRDGHSMAYDRVRNRIVLFGGVGLHATRLTDTWEWDGASWIQHRPTRSPGVGAYRLVFCTTLGMVLYCQLSPSTDMWAWDGANWTQLSPLTQPTQRTQFEIAEDRRRGRLVVYGGRLANTPTATETWEFDGTDWTLRNPTRNPGTRYGHAMAYDSRRGVTVLIGDAGSSTQSSDVWEWDGTEWTQRFPAGAIKAVGDPAVFDSARGRVVLLRNWFTGMETWEYGPIHPATYTPFGAGCAGPSGTPPELAPLPDHWPWLGEAFTVRARVPPAAGGAFLLTGVSRTRLGPFTLPLDLGALGMPGCSLLVSGDVVAPFAWQGGQLLLTLAIPNDPSLAGRHLFQQALAPEPQANSLGAVLSAGMDLAVGSK